MEINKLKEDSKGSKHSPNEPSRKDLSEKHISELCVQNFQNSSYQDQMEFVKKLFSGMCVNQCQEINSFLDLKLKKDIISLLLKTGLDHIVEKIFSYLDADSLLNAENVSQEWQQMIVERMMWKKLIEYNIRTDCFWKGLAERQGWKDILKLKSNEHYPEPSFWKDFYDNSVEFIYQAQCNWERGHFSVHTINCNTENSKGIYCIQFDCQKIISGDRGKTIKIWDHKTLQCSKILRGHSGSILCLQFDNTIIISGSTDSTVRVWDLASGETLNILRYHSAAVVCLRFNETILITSSNDFTVAVWDKISPTNILVRRVLIGHQSSVNVVDFDQKYIISASVDRTIKVWDTSTGEFVRTVNNRKKTMCMQYQYPFIVNGCADYRIKIWDVEGGVCVRILEGHTDIVRCIRFNSERIISGSYDGTIKIWNTSAALNSSVPNDEVCLHTLEYHESRIFGIQIDEFQIVSSSHDDTIKIFDFLGWLDPEGSLMENDTESH